MEREELLALGVEEAAIEKILEEQEKMREEYNGRIEQFKKESEIEKILAGCGARNIKAVRALVGDGDVEEIRAEIEKLKSDEETKFLFEKKGSFAPARSPERLPDVKRNTFEARLNAARREGNTVEAIRIKQEAAAKGIMLI